ncbi:RNA-processing protein [Candidatus Micrarchaeota archaeon]|nr:RNA-processing protein [Candidatus Micrarchaeota archaeon]
MTEIIKIPRERISVLIGKKGQTKKKIEEKCKIKITVRDEEVEISGESENIFFAMDVVRAIGRGFEPRKALQLVKDDYAFYIIHLREVLPSEKAMERIKARIIGEKGKIKTEIENATESFVSVYGHTVGIIAKLETIEYAKEAVYKIISGAPHSGVLSYLAKARRQIMDAKFRGS